MTKDPHLFCRRRCGITLRHVAQSTFRLGSMSHYCGSCYIAIDCTFCHTLALCASTIIQDQRCPLISPRGDYWHPPMHSNNCPHHSRCCYAQTFVAVAPFASYCMRQSMCITPQFSLHRLLSEGRLLSWYSIWKSTFWPAIMLCSSSATM